MVTIEVLESFYDLAAHKLRAVGETFEATERRASDIDAVLPGYIKVTGVDSKADSGKDEPEPTTTESGRETGSTEAQTDLSKMTVAQLRALAAERGTEIPKGSKKADIIALLEE